MTAPNGKASTTRSTFKMTVEVGINIKADPPTLWKLLTTAEEFPQWNSTVKSIEGRIAQGETIKLNATIAPDRTFNLKVTEMIPNQ